MPALDRKLKQWTDAGLIDGRTAAAIAAYEGQRSRPKIPHILLGLGAFAIGVGLISVVAANWQAIGNGAKLSADLALGIVVAAGIWRAHQAQTQWLKDSLIVLYYAYVLASLALVGQIYQLHSPLYQTLVLWSLATAPVMWLGTSSWLGALWAIGLASTYISITAEVAESLENVRGVAEGDAALALTCLGCYAFIFLPRMPVFQHRRAAFSRALTTLGWFSFFAIAMAAQFPWYAEIDARERLSWGPLVGLVLTAAAIVLLPRLYSLSDRALFALRTTMVAVLVLGIGPLATVHPELGVVGALSNLAVLSLFGWIAWQLHWPRVFSIMTAALGLRIVIIYFEVFGSMLSTGLGLMTGGALTMAIAWIWHRRTAVMAKLKRDAE